MPSPRFARIRWPFAVREELFLTAESRGEARIGLRSAREAELFRYALYNHRRATGRGPETSIRIEDTEVIIEKIDPNLTIASLSA